MDELVQGLLISALALCAAATLAVAWARHRVRRHLRINPAVRSCAPTAYLVSPAAAARLHRRLRRVGATARLAAALDAALQPVAAEVVAEALALEPQVLAVRATGHVGATSRRALVARVVELERVAGRLTTLAGACDESASPTSTERIRERLAALEAARREVAEIDLRAGLHLQH